jgi:hypothetical protein
MTFISESADAVWQTGGVACVIVAASLGFDVELRNGEGVAFFRKSVPTPDAARSEAEHLRLLMDRDPAPAADQSRDA